MGVRREFRKVALLTQEMTPDTMFFLLSIPASLGAKDGGNMLLLNVIGYSGVIDIIFSFLRRVWELVWIGLGLLCLALIGGRSLAIQEGRTHDPGNSF